MIQAPRVPLTNGANKLVFQYMRLVRDKQSSLLGPFVSYEENEVLRISLVYEVPP